MILTWQPEKWKNKVTKNDINKCWFTYAPPHSISNVGQVFICFVFHKKTKVWQQAKQDDFEVENNQQLLPLIVEDRPEKLPRSQLPFECNYLKNLEEAMESPKCSKSEYFMSIVRGNVGQSGRENDDKQID